MILGVKDLRTGPSGDGEVKWGGGNEERTLGS